MVRDSGARRGDGGGWPGAPVDNPPEWNAKAYLRLSACALVLGAHEGLRLWNAPAVVGTLCRGRMSPVEKLLILPEKKWKQGQEKIREK